ncbi:MAG: rhomboid family intramembrane serine protease [Blastocatellia bacterium]
MNDSHSPHFIEAFLARQTQLTYAILGVNVLLFVLMLGASYASLSTSLMVGSDTATLINFGAKTNNLLIQQHQWFRFVTPIFLHIGLLHLGLNGYALWMVGPMVEKFYGAGRFAVLYLLTGIGGVIGSWLSTRSPHTPSAGASGALFGLFGVLLVVSYKYRDLLPEPFRKALRRDIFNVLVINFVFSLGNNSGWLSGGGGNGPMHMIDIGGHVGGLVTGAILAALLPALPPSQINLSTREKWLVAICVLIVGVCFGLAYLLRPFHF